MPEAPIQINGPFIRLSPNVWVRADAIVVIRARNEVGSEVIVRSGSVASGGSAAYAIWTDYTHDQIISAIIDATDWVADLGEDA